MNEQSLYSRQVVTPPNAAVPSPENRLKLIEYFIRAGFHAPSWYNCQPWRFEVNTKHDQIDIILDCSRDRSFYDWGHFNSLLACGAALKNILVAADGRGIPTHVQYQQAIAEQALVASITFAFDKISKPTDTSIALEKAIWTRHTNPLMYDDAPLSADELRTLKTSIDDTPNVSLLFLTDEDKKEKVFAAASCAEQLRFSRRDLHEQLYRMIRWNDDEARSEKTGYTLPSMGVCGFGKVFFRITQPWPVMKMMNFLGIYKSHARRACQGLTHCGAIGLLTLNNDRQTSKDLLDAGVALQTIWLTATTNGLNLQPHNSIVQFNWAWKLGGATLFSLREQSILESAFKQYTEVFSDAELNRGKIGVFLFRIGRGEATAGYTLRKDVPTRS